MKKEIKRRHPKASDFVLTWAVSAAAIAMPLTEGGLFNLANYIVLLYGWLFGVLLFIAMFAGPLEKLPTSKRWQRIITDVPRIAGIAVLVYSGFYLHASLLVACWLFALTIYGITKRAYEEQESAKE